MVSVYNFNFKTLSKVSLRLQLNSKKTLESKDQIFFGNFKDYYFLPRMLFEVYVISFSRSQENLQSNSVKVFVGETGYQKPLLKVKGPKYQSFDRAWWQVKFLELWYLRDGP